MSNHPYGHDSICACRCHIKPNPNILSFVEIEVDYNGMDRVYAGNPMDRFCCGLHGEKYINLDGSLDSNAYCNIRLTAHRELRTKNSYEWIRSRK